MIGMLPGVHSAARRRFGLPTVGLSGCRAVGLRRAAGVLGGSADIRTLSGGQHSNAMSLIGDSSL